MGDLLMSSPAIHALKKTFGCKITLLTSSMAAGVARYIGNIDEIIVSDVPWVKGENKEGASGYLQLVDRLKASAFDAAVIFTVFSQNPMPSVMLTYLAGIPLRLAYCRENPYGLLTHWIPEQEPYNFIRHQVTRDLELVANIGSTIENQQLTLEVPDDAYSSASEKLKSAGVNISDQWIIVHPCASERKREFPFDRLKEIIRALCKEANLQIVVTGTTREKIFTDELCHDLGPQVFPAAGMFTLEEFMAVIDITPLLLSVNSGPVHIAAALNTPTVVLYAMTNPQHTPWMVEHEVFYFPVKEELKSNNEVLKYLDKHILEKNIGMPDASQVVKSVMKLLRTVDQPLV